MTAVRWLIVTPHSDVVDVRRHAGWLPDYQGDLESWLAGDRDRVGHGRLRAASYGGGVRPSRLFHLASEGVLRPARHSGAHRRHRTAMQCDCTASKSGVGLPRVHGRLIPPGATRPDAWRVVLRWGAAHCGRSDFPKRTVSDRYRRDRSGPVRCWEAGNRAAGAFGLPVVPLTGSPA